MLIEEVERLIELTDLATRRTQLEGEQHKLLQAHYAGVIPSDLLKKQQDRITAHLGHYAAARENSDDSLSWVVEAKKMGQARTATKGGPLVACSHLTRVG
ncbi:hypothetical protein [Citricoccus sp. NR2]|uniref:hypothetical protein n=1 Tax=Citricoccus sp. NR2 TaxID=3004095 RepID=UPI0022DD4540|nr:hypothetical protein [Citricoccus sp. NR2]WBL18436.1 hypothetical protein O1A05_11785 [Citricoccus sp. NR2]